MRALLDARADVNAETTAEEIVYFHVPKADWSGRGARLRKLPIPAGSTPLSIARLFLKAEWEGHSEVVAALELGAPGPFNFPTEAEVVAQAAEYRALFGSGTHGALALYRHEHSHSHDADCGHAHHDGHHDHGAAPAPRTAEAG